ncbi:HDIG domain-containing protein, partial [Candidatus Peregrinibacteria bacterium]|nr:HDIG domain-containing protein [Candidatus Peregrinibacteria bacterium]
MRDGVISTEAYHRIDSEQVRLRRTGDEEIISRTELSPVFEVMERTMNLVVDPEYPEVSKNLFITLLQRFIRPNVIYNWAETERLRRLAAESVSSTRDERVLQQERIISRGERITTEQMLKLDNLRAELEKRNLISGQSVMAKKDSGIALIYIMLLVLLGIYTYLHRPEFYWRYSKLLLVAVSMAIPIVLSGIVLGNQDIPNYLVPVAVAGMLISYLLDDRYALVTAAILAMITGIQAGFSYYIVLYSLACGAAGALTVRRVASRRQQYMPIIYIFLAAVVVVFSVEFGYRGEELSVLPKPVGWSLVNATFCTFITIPLLPLFEYLFGITSNFTLLELSDLNRPILKRLAIEAPGTYHHSIIIGTLAEAAASGIGANPIYARVGGYYHDIGKLKKPQYFIENQQGKNNPHNRLSPKMSSLIIANHVKEGVELARKARLPECIIDIIRQHHGNQSISFFFSKEKEQNPETTLEEGDFCYPGPRPMCKEAAIIMLADAAESASRTLSEPTVSRIRNLIKGLTEAKMRDGQLDQADLTLRDLSRICEEFLTILIGVHHHRIDYPGAPGLPKDVREKAAKLKAASSGQNGKDEAGKAVSAAEGDGGHGS